MVLLVLYGVNTGTISLMPKQKKSYVYSKPDRPNKIHESESRNFALRQQQKDASVQKTNPLIYKLIAGYLTRFKQWNLNLFE